MKKYFTLFLLLSITALTTNVFTNQSAPPLGNTNAPGNGNCSSCHGSAIFSGSIWSGMSLTTTVPLASMQPSTTYTMNLTFSDPTSSKYGFQLLALPGNANGSTNSLGTVAPGTGNSAVQTATSSGRTYVMHTSAGTSVSNNTKTWNFNYTTPATASNGITFYVAVNSTDGDNSAGPGDDIYIKTFSAGVLPVKWLDVSASVQSNNVLVKWSTSQEINNSEFLIERSTDNINFEAIGLAKGALNSNTVKHYSFADYQMPTSTTFYRIKQVDVDGNFSYSNLVKVEPKLNEHEWHFNTHDNTIYFNSNLPKLVEIFNQNGVNVFNQKTDQINLSLAQLSRGIYYVKISGVFPSYAVKKIIVN